MQLVQTLQGSEKRQRREPLASAGPRAAMARAHHFMAGRINSLRIWPAL